MDRCSDRGIDSFKRYLALAMDARTPNRLGAILSGEEAEAAAKEQRRKRSANPLTAA